MTLIKKNILPAGDDENLETRVEESDFTKVYASEIPHVSGKPRITSALHKRLLYRSEHCGTQENDLIFGRFARLYLDELKEFELLEYERLLTLPDPLLTAWVTGQEEIPPESRTPLMRKIKESVKKPDLRGPAKV